MSIVVRFNPDGLTAADYDETSRQVQESTQWPPDGLLLHVCFGDDGDLKVSEIWESREQFEAFSAELMPLLQQAGIRLSGPPQVFEVHALEQS